MKFEITSEGLGEVSSLLLEVPYKYSRPVIQALERNLKKVENVTNDKEEENEAESSGSADD